MWLNKIDAIIIIMQYMVYSCMGILWMFRIYQENMSSVNLSVFMGPPSINKYIRFFAKICSIYTKFYFSIFILSLMVYQSIFLAFYNLMSTLYKIGNYIIKEQFQFWLHELCMCICTHTHIHILKSTSVSFTHLATIPG